MAQALLRFRPAATAAEPLLRAAMVTACALALVLAGQPLPF